MEVVKMGLLSPRQFRTLLEQPREEMDSIRIEFLLNTGVRYPEAQGFMFSHFDQSYRHRHNIYYLSEAWA